MKFFSSLSLSRELRAAAFLVAGFALAWPAHAAPATAGDVAQRSQRPLPARLYEPDKSGVVLLVSRPELDTQVMSNPFEIRVQPELVTTDVEIEVGGIIKGMDASKYTALINGRVYSVNDRINDKLRVYMVNDDSVIFEATDKFVRVPRTEKITVRLPQI